MKVICIDNVSTTWRTPITTDLVIGAIYEVVDYDPDKVYEMYQIKTDDPEVKAAFYSVELFQKLDDWREEKLKELGL